jgi:hypothetical protein
MIPVTSTSVGCTVRLHIPAVTGQLQLVVPEGGEGDAIAEAHTEPVGHQLVDRHLVRRVRVRKRPATITGRPISEAPAGSRYTSAATGNGGPVRSREHPDHRTDPRRVVDLAELEERRHLVVEVIVRRGGHPAVRPHEQDDGVGARVVLLELRPPLVGPPDAGQRRHHDATPDARQHHEHDGGGEVGPKPRSRDEQRRPMS